MTQTESLLSRMQQLSRLKPAGSFVPKLNEGQRIAVYALSKHGATREALAQVFGIHRNSVAHIINPHSSRYKKTRKDYDGMGEKEAFRLYVTPSMVEQIEQVMANPAAPQASRRDPNEPDQRARQRAGNWTNDAGEPMKVVWQKGTYGEGWYALVEGNGGEWEPIMPMGREKPFKTSTEAYNEGKKL